MTDAILAGKPEPDRPGSLSAATVALLPVLLVTGVAIRVWELMIFAIMANPMLNLSIIGIAVIAALYALGLARRIDRERRQIAGLDRDLAAAALRPDAETALPGAVGRAVAKLAAAARAEGRKAFAQSLDREIEGLRSRLAHRLSILQYVTGLLISLGLLGTFLGLLRTLVASSEVLQAVGLGVDPAAVGDPTEAFATMVLSLQAPLTNMGTAFSSSLFGLVGSITIGVMALIAQRAGMANIGAFRELVTTRQAGLFSFRTSEPVEAEVVEDILAAMLDRERLALQRTDRVLGELGRMAESVTALSGPIAASTARIADGMAALDGLPQWCGRNDGLAQGLADTVDRLDRIGEALAGQTALLGAMAARQDRDAVQAAGELASLAREQAAARAVAEAALAALQRLGDETGALRGDLSRGADRAAQALAALAEDQGRTRAAVEAAVVAAVEAAGQQVAAPLAQVQGAVAALAAAAQDARRETQDARAAALRQGLDALAGLQAGNAALQRTAEAAGTTLADLAARAAAADGALAALAAAAPGMAGTLRSVATAAAALPGIDRAARQIDAAVGRIGDQLGGAEALPGSLGATVQAIAASVTAQEATVAALADRAGRLETSGGRIDDRLGAAAATLDRIAARLAAEPPGAEVLQELTRIGAAVAAQSAAQSAALADEARAARDRGGETGAALARLTEVAADIRTQAGALLAGAGAGRDGIAAADDRLRELAATLATMRDLLAAPPAPAGVMQELARTREDLGHLAGTLGDGARLGLQSQDQIAAALRSLAGVLAGLRSPDPAQTEAAERTREELARFAASLDLVAQTDRDRAALVEKLTALVAAMRLQQDRASQAEARQSGEIDAVRAALSGFEARLTGLLRRVERYLGRSRRD